MAVSIPDRTAEDLLARWLTLVHRLPSALEALESGLLHVGHLWVFLDKVAPIEERSLRQRLERDQRVAELDLHDPWPHGTTAADGMTGFCTRHHRGKHQPSGWTYDLTDHGIPAVTTPTGVTACTDPPPF